MSLPIALATAVLAQCLHSRRARVALLATAFGTMTLTLPTFYGVCVGVATSEPCEGYVRAGLGSCPSCLQVTRTVLVSTLHAPGC
jgi:hypothetical protein